MRQRPVGKGTALLQAQADGAERGAANAGADHEQVAARPGRLRQQDAAVASCVSERHIPKAFGDVEAAEGW